MKMLMHWVFVYLFCLIGIPSFSQNYIQIKNCWQKDGRTTYKIHIQNPTVDAGATQPNWWSTQWVVEPVSGTNYVRFRNRWIKDGRTNYYLHNQNGKIEAGAIQPGWPSAQWELEPVPGTSFFRIKNRWKPTQYLHIQNPSLEVGTIQPNWMSAQWELEGYTPPVNNISPISWITRNYEQLKNKPLNRLVLPGTHDSGTFNLNGTWNRGVNDPFAPDTDDLKRGLSFLGDGYDKWAKAQERTIYQQLQDGIRYIDVRVCVDKSGNLKTCHGLYGISLTELINDVVKFANEYPREPILLDFNHFYDWDEKIRNGKENDAGYGGIRQSKLDELAGMIERTIGPRLAPNSLSPTSTLAQLVATGRPIIVLWAKSRQGTFQQQYFWQTGQIVSSYSDDIKEIRTDKISHLDSRIRANQTTSSFFNLVGQITPSNDLYKRSYDFTGNYPFGLENLAKQTNPVVLSYLANEWKNLKHNIISIDFYNQTSLVELCKQLNGLPANPTGVSFADRNKSSWGQWNLGVGDLFDTATDSEWKVEIDACHSDLSDTETGNRITVQFWAGSERMGSVYRDGVSSGCKIWEGNAVYTFKTSREITHIVVTTNGSDAFYIDEIYLYRGETLKKHHGRDDGSGWCLSTDPNDAKGNWAGKVAGNTCKSEVRFDY